MKPKTKPVKTDDANRQRIEAIIKNLGAFMPAKLTDAEQIESARIEAQRIRQLIKDEVDAEKLRLKRPKRSKLYVEDVIIPKVESVDSTIWTSFDKVKISLGINALINGIADQHLQLAASGLGVNVNYSANNFIDAMHVSPQSLLRRFEALDKIYNNAEWNNELVAGLLREFFSFGGEVDKYIDGVFKTQKATEKHMANAKARQKEQEPYFKEISRLINEGYNRRSAVCKVWGKYERNREAREKMHTGTEKALHMAYDRYLDRWQERRQQVIDRLEERKIRKSKKPI